MRYINARDVLPRDVLELIQEHIDGEYVYIPRKTDQRKAWGGNTRAKEETRKRNEAIVARHKAGCTVTELTNEYFLSEKSIERILTQSRKLEHE